MKSIGTAHTARRALEQPERPRGRELEASLLRAPREGLRRPRPENRAADRPAGTGICRMPPWPRRSASPRPAAARAANRRATEAPPSVQMLGQSSCLTAPATSLSRPSASMRARSATTAAHSPVVWVMLPSRNPGHTGCRSGAAGTGCSASPNSARARRAHWRPAANSCTRLGTAWATLCASAGSSRRASPGARSSAATTPPEEQLGERARQHRRIVRIDRHFFRRFPLPCPAGNG